MAPPQSRKDKWFMRGKDTLLLVVGCGGFIYGVVVSGVDISRAPKRIADLASKVDVMQSNAYAMDKRVSLLEQSVQQQTSLLMEVRDTQKSIWKSIRTIKETGRPE